MRKYFYLFLLSCMSLSLMMVSCKKKSDQAAQEQEALGDAYVAPLSSLGDYTACIPSDAMMIFKVNLGGMLDKSAVLTDEAIRKEVNPLLEELDGDVKKLATKMLKNPDACGVNFHQHALLAISNMRNRSVDMVVSMALADAKQFEKTLNLIADESGVELDIHEENGVKTIYVADEPFCSYNTKSLVLRFRNGDFMLATRYLSLGADEQARNSDIYKQFFYAGEDIAMAFDYEAVMRMAAQQMDDMYYDNPQSEMMEAMMPLYEGMSAYATLNFGKGNVAMTSVVNGMSDALKDFQKFQKKPTNNNYQYVPANASAIMNMAVPDLKGILSSDLLSEYVDALDELLSMVNLTRNDLAALSGDMTLALLPVEKMGDEELPQVMAMVGCKSVDAFEKVMEVFERESGTSLEQVTDNVYAMGVNTSWDYYNDTYETEGYDYYFGWVDGYLFCMPENIYRKVVVDGHFKALSSSIASSAYLEKIKANGGMVAIADRLVQLGDQMNVFRHSEGRMMRKYLSMFDQAVFYQVSDNKAVLMATVKSDYASQNILKTVKDVLVEDFLNN